VPLACSTTLYKISLETSNPLNVFHRGSDRYAAGLKRVPRPKAAAMGVYVTLLLVAGVLFRLFPSGFVPLLDRTFLIASVQLPNSSTLDRSEAVTRRMSELAAQDPDVLASLGFPGAVSERPNQ
jgi:multidrug efflux pump